MPVWNLPGLSSQTRSIEDQKEIELQGIDYNKGAIRDSSSFKTISYTAPNKGLGFLAKDLVEDQTQTFNTLQTKYQEEANINQPGASYKIEEKYITDIAYKISPYYRKYRNTDYLTLTDEDWAKISSEYKARKDTYGEDNANTFLQSQVQDNVANNQGVLEKMWNGFRNMGASTAGALTSIYGNLVGGTRYITGNGYEVEGLNEWQNFWNNVIDNDITRYGDDMIKYGTYDKDKIERAKTLYGGISEIPVLATKDQERTIFNINTIPTALSQGGFTVATMMMGAGEAKVAQLAFSGVKSGIKAATLANRAALTTEKLNHARKTLEVVTKIEKANNAFILPAIAGTHEGLIEGLGTKLEVLEGGKRILAEQQESAVNKRAAELIKSNPSLDIEDAKKIAFDEYADKYEKSLDQIEYAASKAGINNFYVNAAINGVIAGTLKAGLQAAPVQGALQKSKLTSWAFPKGTFEVTGTGARTKVTPKLSTNKMVLNIAKEPAGEFSEEYLQSISDASMSGAAEYNITKFIENKYNGDSSVAVGDDFSGQFAAGFTALTGSLTDKEAIKSGIYGAISSILGTPTISARNYISRTKQADGSYKTKADFSRREGEGALEYATRLMPWRSGLVNSIRENRAELESKTKEAEILTEWIRDPRNKDKFDGTIGTISWARDMETSGATNDEFGYRNSVLGKTINDAILLEKLKGTAFYDTYMDSVVKVADVEGGSQEATSIVRSIKQDINVAPNFEGMSDSEILTQVKKNANKMLNTMSEIQQESDRLDRVLGNIDDDTKISLIFGKLSIKDWQERGPKVQEDIKAATNGITNTAEASNLSQQQKQILGVFGSFKRADTKVSEMQKEMAKLEEDIKNIQARKGVAPAENKILKSKQARYNSLKKFVDKYTSKEEVKTYEKIKDIVLNEEEILALPKDIRATMLNPNNLANYSEPQQDVIKNIMERGNANDTEFSNKIQDAGRIAIAEKTFLTQYNSILTDPNSFNLYVARQKEAANDILTKEKFNSISQIETYSEFANELDKLLSSGSQREKTLIIKALKENNNQNFLKYEKDRESIQKLMDQFVEDETFKNLDANDADMLVHTLEYLSNRDIDVQDVEAATGALSELDNNGNSIFQKYIEDSNSVLPEQEKTIFTSIGEAIQIYKDVLANSNKDIEQKQKVETPIEPIETTPKESAPAVTVEPEIREATKEEVKEGTKTEEKSIVEEIAAKEVVTNSILDRALTIITNLLDRKPQIIKDKSLLTIKEIFNTIDVTEEEFIQALLSEANKLSAQTSDPNNFETANVLRQVAQRLITQSGKTSTEVLRGEKSKNIFETSSNTANSSIIESLNMEYVMSKYPDGALAKYYKKYKIKEFLLQDKIDNNTPVMFIVDTQLSEAVKQEVIANGGRYNELLSCPVIAVVEVESSGITINTKDGDRHYQPIAIMPATDNQRSSGAARMSEIRKAAIAAKSNNELLIDSEGNTIISSINGKVVASPPNHLPQTEDNRSVQTLQMHDLSSEERQELEGKDKIERRKSPIYQAFKKKFLSKLRVINGNTLTYEVSNLKGEVIPIQAFISPVQRTKDKNSDKTIAQLFNDNDTSVLKSNSRIERAHATIKRFFKEEFKPDELEFEEVNDTLVPTEESQQLLNSYADRLGKSIGKFLALPTKQNWRYSLVPTTIITPDGRRVFTLSLASSFGEIILGNVTNGNITDESATNIFKHMFMGENGAVRMRDAINSFVIWNVPFNDINNLETVAQDNISRIYDDDIIEFSKDSLEYTVKGVNINTPFTIDGNPNYFKATVKKQFQEQASKEGFIIQSTTLPKIDSDTGAILEGSANTRSSSNTAEQVEMKTVPTGSLTDLRKKRKTVEKELTIEMPEELQWGKFDTSKMTINEIFDALEAKGITTEAQWNSRTQEEREHELKCCGAV